VMLVRLPLNPPLATIIHSIDSERAVTKNPSIVFTACMIV
jgi:hypothetical protein